MLSVRGAEHPVLHWTTVTALIALSVVTLSACLVRACREPDAVSWVELEPAQQRVPAAPTNRDLRRPLDSAARVMQGDGSVLNLLPPRRWPCAVTGARPS